MTPYERLVKITGEVSRMDVEQNTESWRALRMGRITGSLAVSLLSQPRLKSEKESGIPGQGGKTLVYGKFWENMVEPSSIVPDFSNPSTDWGHNNELEAVNEFQEQTGIEVYAGGFYADQNGIVGCSPDGDCLISKIVEVKCPSSIGKHIQYCVEESEELPKDYIAQMQWNILLTQSESCYFISYDKRLRTSFRLHWREIKSDPEFQNQLIDGLERCLAYYEWVGEKITLQDLLF